MKRWLIVPLLLIGFSSAALAQEDVSIAPIDLVPGKPIYWDWSGFYLGGQFGMSSAVMDPSNATSKMLANMLRGTVLEKETNVSSLINMPQESAGRTEFGGFVGYNRQWSDVILGIELNYNTGGTLNTTSSDAFERLYKNLSDGYDHDVTVSSENTVALKDYATARLRAGYVMGRYLPYAMVGFALGRADVSNRVTVLDNMTDADPANPPALAPLTYGPATSTQSRKGAFLYGIDTGVGLDVAVTSNVFVRAEYEYLYFFPFMQTHISINAGRVGVGFKF